jgi:hypothetical protein
LLSSGFVKDELKIGDAKALQSLAQGIAHKCSKPCKSALKEQYNPAQRNALGTERREVCALKGQNKGEMADVALSGRGFVLYISYPTRWVGLVY